MLIGTNLAPYKDTGMVFLYGKSFLIRNHKCMNDKPKEVTQLQPEIFRFISKFFSYNKSMINFNLDRSSITWAMIHSGCVSRTQALKDISIYAKPKGVLFSLPNVLLYVLPSSLDFDGLLMNRDPGQSDTVLCPASRACGS